MNEKQLQEWADFKKNLESALSQFTAQTADVNAVKQALADMSAELIKLREFGKVDVGPGFQDAETAKGFIDFVSAIYNRDATLLKDMTEGTDSEGGHLVPDEFRPVLIRLVETFGLARQYATVLPMSRMELHIPKLASGVTVYWIGEAGAITQSQPSFGLLNLIAKKMAALVPVTGELLEDSSIAIANLLATLFAEAIAKEEDRIAFAGDVTGVGDPFNGLLHDSDVISVAMGAGKTSFADVNADDIASLVVAPASSAAEGARLLLHRTVFNVIRTLKTTTGEYIYAAPGGNQPATLWSYPYSLTDVMPAITESAVDKPFIGFGNLRHLYIGDRKKMGIALSTHVGFANDLTYIRVIQREAIAIGLGAAFAALKTAAV